MSTPEPHSVQRVNATANFASLTAHDHHLPYDASGALVRPQGFGAINGVAPAPTAGHDTLHVLAFLRCAPRPRRHAQWQGRTPRHVLVGVHRKIEGPGSTRFRGPSFFRAHATAYAYGLGSRGRGVRWRDDRPRAPALIVTLVHGPFPRMAAQVARELRALWQRLTGSVALSHAGWPPSPDGVVRSGSTFARPSSRGSPKRGADRDVYWTGGIAFAIASRPPTACGVLERLAAECRACHSRRGHSHVGRGHRRAR